MKRFYWSLYSTPVSKGADDEGYIEAETLADAQQMAIAEIMPDSLKSAKWIWIDLTKYYGKADGVYTFLLKETGVVIKEEGVDKSEKPRWYSNRA